MNTKTRIRVDQSGIIHLKCFKDLPDGNLFIAEAQREIPFSIKRVYFINSLANPAAVRGRHAHRQLEQAIFCVSGSFMLYLDDGQRKQRLQLSNPSLGVRLGPWLWHTMSNFSYDCVILVFAAEWFRESDYIRDYSEFQRLVRCKSGASSPAADRRG